MSGAVPLLPLCAFMGVRRQLRPFSLTSTYMKTHHNPNKQVIFQLLPAHTTYDDGTDMARRNVGI